ncbi:MAG: toxin-antitoxin system HicB family antitoxin [Candidatus Aminicenantaceae bacterium]
MKKDLSYYLSLNYPIIINKEIDDGKTYYVGEIPDLPGCGAHGETIDAAIKSLDEARRLWIEGSYEKGLDIPEPVSEDEFSGKFLLRIPPKLHMELSKNAEKENMSLNQYIRNSLERDINLETMLKRIESLERKVSEERKIYIKNKSKNYNKR